MKIGIDCQYLLTNISAGPEKYAINLLRSLFKIDQNNEYILYFKKEPSQDFLSELTSSNENVKVKVLTSKLSWTQVALMKELRKDLPDVFFTPFHTLPVLDTLCFFRLRKIKWVSMIHGVDYVFEHKWVLKKFWQFFPLWYTARFSDKVIVPSKHTKEKITKFGWGKAPEDVFVIPEGVSPIFKKYPLDEVREVKSRYDLEDTPYLIFISTIQPRKNVPGLVEGFSIALRSKKNLENLKLAIVGKRGWDFDESIESPRKFGVEEEVIFLGRVSDEDLPKLLSGSSGYVSTSFEEGFGLPLLEAMASEVPYVVSDISSYKVISEGTGIFVDPYDPGSIASGIAEIINDYPEGYIENAKRISKKYSWENTAEKTLKVFEEK